MSTAFVDESGTTRLRGSLVPAPGGSQPITQVRVPVSSAELLDLEANPVEIVAAPGAGKAIVPVAVSFAYIAGLTPYTDNSSALILASIFDGGLPQNSCAVSVAGFLDQAVDMCVSGVGAGTFGTAYPTPEVADAPLVLGIDHDVADGDGTLIVSVAYVVLDTD